MNGRIVCRIYPVTDVASRNMVFAMIVNLSIFDLTINILVNRIEKPRVTIEKFSKMGFGFNASLALRKIFAA